jgi:hypothetical protein
MITNWTKKKDGVWKGFIIFLNDNEEEKTEIYDGQTWGEWFSNWFSR